MIPRRKIFFTVLVVLLVAAFLAISRTGKGDMPNDNPNGYRGEPQENPQDSYMLAVEGEYGTETDIQIVYLNRFTDPVGWKEKIAGSKRIVRTGGDDTEPRWSPDGQYLFWYGTTNQRKYMNLFVADKDGNNPIPLSEGIRIGQAYWTGQSELSFTVEKYGGGWSFYVYDAQRNILYPILEDLMVDGLMLHGARSGYIAFLWTRASNSTSVRWMTTSGQIQPLVDQDVVLYRSAPNTAVTFTLKDGTTIIYPAGYMVIQNCGSMTVPSYMPCSIISDLNGDHAIESREVYDQLMLLPVIWTPKP